MYATRFGLYSGYLQACQYNNLITEDIQHCCIDIPEDGLNTGRNMQHTCKGTISNDINVYLMRIGPCIISIFE